MKPTCYAVLVLAMLASSLTASGAPNLIVIPTDDQSYHDVGFNGSTITALAHAPVQPEVPLDGVNLIPYLTGLKMEPANDVANAAGHPRTQHAATHRHRHRKN